MFFLLIGLKKSNQSSKHLSQKVAMKVRFSTLLINSTLSSRICLLLSGNFFVLYKISKPVKNRYGVMQEVF